MNLNGILKSGNKCDILIKCAADVQIGERLYKAQEPYTILKDVEVSLEHSTSNKKVDIAKGHVLSNNIDYIDLLAVRHIMPSQKIRALLYPSCQGATNLTTVENIMTQKHYPIYLPTTDQKFIYCNGELIDDWQEDTLDHSITINNYDETNNYLLFYKYTEVGEICQLSSSPNYPYFSLEITSTVNIDNQTSKITIILPQCSLYTNKDFDFDNDGINDVKLNFVIINNKNNKMVFYN